MTLFIKHSKHSKHVPSTGQDGIYPRELRTISTRGESCVLWGTEQLMMQKNRHSGLLQVRRQTSVTCESAIRSIKKGIYQFGLPYASRSDG